ncbi:MAG: hypothetical protein SFU85_07740 [Candidatus Methylacidiphilales bacterium]|nr:hypothetical protein [Candidatus Methylacidiphilales bacterium]
MLSRWHASWTDSDLARQVGLILAVAVFFGFLQWVRPYFFLTDDNLTGWHPIVMEVGRGLLAGKSPLHNPFQYGGFSILSDPGALVTVNPVALVISAVTAATGALAGAELFAFFALSLSAWSFYRLVGVLRESWGVDLSPGAGVLLSLSYAFNFYGLTIGASWVQFLGTQAALPLLLGGILEKDVVRSWKWLLAGSFCNLWLSHLHPYLYSTLFMSILVLAWFGVHRNPMLLVRWGVCQTVMLLTVLPILLPGYQSVGQSSRSEVVDVVNTSLGGVHLLAQVGGLFVAPLVFLLRGEAKFDEQAVYSDMTLMSGVCLCLFVVMIGVHGRRFPILVGTAAALSLAIFFVLGEALAAVICAAFFIATVGLWQWLRDRRTSALEWCLFGVLGLVMLFVQRPAWLAELLLQIPVFKYLRWPFRECLLIVFLVHVLLCFGARFVSSRWFKGGIMAGLLVVLGMLAYAGAPTLNLMPQDRRLILGGQARAWWDGNMRELDDGRRWVPVMAEKDFKLLRYDTPFCLLGAFNYPSLYRVPSTIGYMGNWMNYPGDITFQDCYHWSGLISPEKYDAFCAAGKTFNKVVLELKPGGMLLTASSSRGSRMLWLPWVLRDARKTGFAFPDGPQ